MACADNKLLVHAYLDGELDLVRSLELEEHLRGCEPCAAELRDQQTLQKALRTSDLYEAAPAGLAERIRTGLPGRESLPKPATQPVGADTVVHFRRHDVRRRVLEWVAVAAAIFVTIVLTLRFFPGVLGTSPSQLLAQEVISSHIRSLQPGHLLDVQSTDQHTVKPWFDGRLDFSPPVVDLADQGFPLIGGRLDYLGSRNVAALVYQRRKHIVTVYIWPANAGPKPPASFTGQGYNVVTWQHGGMAFCAVSDVNSGDLRTFSGLLER